MMNGYRTVQVLEIKRVEVTDVKVAGSAARYWGYGLVGVGVLALAIVGAYLLGARDATEDDGPSVVWSAPVDGQEFSGSQGVTVAGVANDIGDESLWLFDVADGRDGGLVYYLVSERAIATANQAFSVEDRPIGDGANDIGATFRVAIVRASSACSSVLENATPNQEGAIVFETLPSGCRDVGQRSIVKTGP